MSEFALDSFIQVEFCSQCKGMWLDQGELGKSCGKSHDFPEWAWMIGTEIQTDLPCVRCGKDKPLIRRQYAPNSVDVEFCQFCSGIFLDFRELPAVQAILKASPAPLTETASIRGKFKDPSAHPLKNEIAPQSPVSRSRPWRILVSVIFVLVVLPSFFGRVSFLSRAVPATGKVIEITASNSRCQDFFDKHRHDCTEFSASVEYLAKDHSKQIGVLSAGNVRGQDHSILEAELQPPMLIQILYDPEDFGRISRDRFWNGWGGTLIGVIAWVIGLTFFVGKRFDKFWVRSSELKA